MATAFLKNYRQSPRKVRLVADTIRGKRITEAQTTLDFMPKRAALPLKKLLDSAIANAKVNGEALDTLIVTKITVQPGVTLHRSMPKWRGMAHPIKKRSSHVTIELGAGKASAKAKAAAAPELTEKKPAAKKTQKSAPKTVTKKPAKKTTK